MRLDGHPLKIHLSLRLTANGDRPLFFPTNKITVFATIDRFTRPSIRPTRFIYLLTTDFVIFAVYDFFDKPFRVK